MITRSCIFNQPAPIIIIVCILLCSPVYISASSLSGAVKGLKINQINNFNEIKTALSLLQTSHHETVKNNNQDLMLQQIIL
jgi:hypothetical protein